MNRRYSRWLAGSLLALLVVVASGRIDAQQPLGNATPAIRPTEGRPSATPLLGSSSAIRPLATSITRQGDLLRFQRDIAGDAKPIVLEADRVVTWNEGGMVVFLLEGHGLAQQSVVQTRFQRAVAFVDLPRYQNTGILHASIYAEGQVRLDTSVEVQDGPRAALDLNSRGELKLRVLKGKVQRETQANDPLIVRAKQLGVGTKPVTQPATSSIAPPPGSSPPVASPPVASPPVAPPPGTTPPPGTSAPIPGVSALRPELSPKVRTVAFEESETPPAVTPPTETPLPKTSRTTVPPLPLPASSLGKKSENRSPEQPGSLLPPGRSGDNAQPAPVPVPEPTPTVPAVTVPGQTPLPVARQVPVISPTPDNAPGPRRRLQYRIGSRTGAENWNVERTQLEDGRAMITVSNGVILNVSGVQGLGALEVEADRAVIWTRGDDASRSGSGSGDLEFYMAGHVVLRTQRPQTGDRVIIDADELYYDTRRNVAVALKSRLEVKPKLRAGTQITLTEPIVLTAEKLFQTSETTYEVVNSEVFSSRLPSDPGLKLIVAHATMEERRTPRTDLFGRPVVNPRTGEQLTQVESLLSAENVFATAGGVPLFYTPYLYTDARDPLGPLVSVHLGGSRIFGFQTGIGLDVYKLLGVLPYDGTRWRAYVDYMTRRGPGLGTNFFYNGSLFEAAPEELQLFPEKVQLGQYNGVVRLYGIYDQATDILGSQPVDLLTFNPSGFRGRAYWQQSVWDLPGGFDVHAQFSKWSDRNFLEQYYKREFDTTPNQATYALLKQQQDNWSWSVLAEGRVNPWVTTTESLPRLDGYVQGLDLFGLFTSHSHATIGYHRLAVSNDPRTPIQSNAVPPGTLPIQDQTTQQISTARAAFLQELSYPVNFGAVTLSPYVKGALVGYSEDLHGDSAGQAWGGVGLKAHLPLTKLYSDVQSELFNINGLNHKINLEANYFWAQAVNKHTQFGQIDRLNDFTTDQALREFTPYQPIYNPSNGLSMATSRLFDPQMFAIRRLIDNRFDTLDDVNVLQLEARQRLQTKRGFPGSQHIVDWMTLDTSVSLYPQANRDNFGKSFAFAEYNYQWNIGDRTSFQSTGWFDPNDGGPRVLTLGMYFDRPDRTSFYLGYRQIDPLNSRAITGSMSYVFSPKYSMRFIVSYDLGQSASLGNSVLFTRTGKDFQVSLGFTYNTYQNNVGAILEIVPNLAANRTNGPGGLLNQQSMGGFGR